MGPLSAKQYREYLKFNNQEQRETTKMEREEARKQQLHNIKLIEAASKAGQSIGHKEEIHQYKMGTQKVSPLGKSKIKTPNPLAGTEMFGQGQHMLPFQAADAAKARKQNTDTVPAMLTPGEAVIPEPAAQDPKNKPIIKKMVQQGRQANKAKKGFLGLRDGSVNIAYSDAIPSRVQQAAGYAQGTSAVPQLMNYNDGTSGVPSLAYRHPDTPQTSFEDGTERVYDFNRGSADRQYYMDGIEEVPVDPLVTQGSAITAIETVIPANSAPPSMAPQPMVEEVPAQEAVVPMEVQEVPVVAGLREDQVSSVNKPMQFMPSDSLLNAQIETESKGFHRDKNGKLIQSKKGALGVSQVMPKTGVDPGYGVKPLANSSEAEYKRFQKDYMAAMLKEYNGDEEKALAAYNYGPGNVNQLIIDYKDKWKNELPLETKSYLTKTLSLRDQLEAKNKTSLPAPTPRDILIAKQDLATSTNPQVRARAQAILDAAKLPIPTIASNYQESAIVKKRTPYEDIRLLTNDKPVFGLSNTEPPKVAVKDPNAVARENLSTRMDVDELGNPLEPKLQQEQPIELDNPPVIIPESMKNLEDPLATEGEVVLGMTPEMLKEYADKVNVPPVGTTREEIEANQVMEKDARVAQISQDEHDAMDAEVKRLLNTYGKTPEAESKITQLLSSIYGPEGIFSQKELVRFAVVAAGGMLTGGSTAGSLKYAARDALQYADNRNRAEAARAEQVADRKLSRAERLADYDKQRKDTISDMDKRDARAAAQLRYKENVKLEKDLYDQGYDKARIKKYLTSGDPADLGDAVDSHVVAGTGKNITFDDGSGEFKAYPTVTLKATRGPNKGEKVQAVVITDKDGNKQYVPVNELPQTPIDYDAKVHSTAGQLDAMVKNKPNIEKLSEGLITRSFGNKTEKDKPNMGRSMIPTSETIADQALSWANANKYKVYNTSQLLELNNVIGLATQDMIDYSKVAKVEAKSIEGFLESSKIKIRAGITQDAFLTDSKIPMSPAKVLELKSKAESLVDKPSLEKQLGKKLTKEDIEKAAYDNMSRAYRAFSSNPKISNKYPNAKEESGFYMYAMREAFK